MNDLQSRFGIPDKLTFEPGAGGLTRMAVNTPQVQGHVYLHGAHVSHFQPAGHEPVLFMSGSSWFEAGKPIRGGVPICFPWFGPRAGHPEAPGHGFVRLLPWEVLATREEAGSVTVELGLRSSEQTRQLWPHDFEMHHTIVFGATLSMTLQVRNLSREPLSFEAALHTYLAVGDVRQVSVTGLEQTQYVSKVEGGQALRQGSDPIRIARETDRVYQQTAAACVLDDPSLGRRIIVRKSGSETTVVWNPWVDKSRAMPDFGDEEWPGMICIETANAGPATVTLSPGQTHTVQAIIEVARRAGATGDRGQ